MVAAVRCRCAAPVVAIGPRRVPPKTWLQRHHRPRASKGLIRLITSHGIKTCGRTPKKSYEQILGTKRKQLQVLNIINAGTKNVRSLQKGQGSRALRVVHHVGPIWWKCCSLWPSKWWQLNQFLQQGSTQASSWWFLLIDQDAAPCSTEFKVVFLDVFFSHRSLYGHVLSLSILQVQQQIVHHLVIHLRFGRIYSSEQNPKTDHKEDLFLEAFSKHLFTLFYPTQNWKIEEKNKMKPTNPNADTYVDKQRQYLIVTFPANSLVRHPEFTHWGDALVGHPCLTLLRNALVRQSCLTLLWDTLVRHFLLDTLVRHSYLTFLWDILPWHSYLTPV